MVRNQWPAWPEYALNRLTERTVPGSATHTAGSGATVSHEYKYDLAGRRKEGIHAWVRQVYSHDTAGRPTNVAQVHLAPYSSGGKVPGGKVPGG